MGTGDAAIAAILALDGVSVGVDAVLFLALEKVEHALDKVVDVEEGQLDTRVVHRIGLVVGDRPAKRAHGGVVLRARMAHEVVEAIDGDLRTGFLAVFEEELLPRKLAATVFGVSKAARERGLDAAREHDGAFVAGGAELVDELRREAEVALHEVLGILRAVHAGEVEHEVGLRAPLLKLFRSGIQVILVNVFDTEVGPRTVFPIP